MPSDLGRNSRAVVRLLDSIKTLDSGGFHEGVLIENEAVIRIELEIKRDYEHSFSLNLNDNKILMAACHLKDKGELVVFVSKDLAARVKADALGLETEDYENLKFAYESIYRGIRHLEIPKPQIDQFYKDGILGLSIADFKPNEYCILTSPEHSSAIGKFDYHRGQLEQLIKIPNVWGVKPRNVEQRCAMDAMLRDDIKLVSMMGPAGTGKTLLALACGLRKVFDEGVYTRILVSRPIMPLGRDIGYLPGTKEEKLFNWMQPIYDNLEFLCNSSGNEPSETLRYVMESKKIEMEAVTYIRGRSLPKMFMIIDEAQNLTPHEIKTIISRAGEGTKVILCGDATQIDNPYLDKDSNGLTVTVAKFCDQKIYGHVFLDKTERSELAAIAADIM